MTPQLRFLAPGRVCCASYLPDGTPIAPRYPCAKCKAHFAAAVPAPTRVGTGKDEPPAPPSWDDMAKAVVKQHGPAPRLVDPQRENALRKNFFAVHEEPAK